MKQIFIFLVILFSLTPTVYSQNAPLKLGAERMDVVTRLLKGKRVGLVVNQTSILEKRQIHLLDALVAEGIDVKKVFAPEHGFRGTGDANHSQKTVFMVKRHVDTLACSCKIVRFSYLYGSTGYSSFPSDLMIGSDPGRVCTGDNWAGRGDKIDIVTADVLDRVDDLLGKSVADVCDHGILLERLIVFILRKV